MFAHARFGGLGIPRAERGGNRLMLLVRLLRAARPGARTETINPQDMIEILAQRALQPAITAAARDAEVKIVVAPGLIIGRARGEIRLRYVRGETGGEFV